jgi:hypothetical protein
VLNIFNNGGGWVGQVPFPDHDGPGAAAGPLNVWQSGNASVLMVTANYRRPLYGGYDVRLIAFSTTGGVLADQVVTSYVPTTTGGWGRPSWQTWMCLFPPTVPVCLGGMPFEHGILSLTPPPPGVGIFTYQGGGTPFIMVSDHIQDLVGYTFTGNSFIERFRVHEKDRYMRSTPTILPDAHTIIGVEKIAHDTDGAESVSGQGGVMFAGPNQNPLPRLEGIGPVYGTPTRMADGRVALVSGFGRLTILQGGQIAAQISVPGQSIASAAASRSHLFVSTSDAFLSYDTNSLAELGRINWVGGGKSPPAIGPKGHVYAIASNILFVFPPPNRKVIDTGTIAQPPQDVITVDPGQPTTQPSSQLYHPPLTANGNRLFACEELDQDDCGKGDHKDISLAWCQKQGYSKVKGYDVDSRNVKAETLDGKFCSKNKCKVFDSIRCEM